MAMTCKHGLQFYCADCKNAGHFTPNIPDRPWDQFRAGLIARVIGEFRSSFADVTPEEQEHIALFVDEMTDAIRARFRSRTAA